MRTGTRFISTPINGRWLGRMRSRLPAFKARIPFCRVDSGSERPCGCLGDRKPPHRSPVAPLPSVTPSCTCRGEVFSCRSLWRHPVFSNRKALQVCASPERGASGHPGGRSGYQDHLLTMAPTMGRRNEINRLAWEDVNLASCTPSGRGTEGDRDDGQETPRKFPPKRKRGHRPKSVTP